AASIDVDHQRRASASVYAKARVRESEGRRKSMGQASETGDSYFCGRNLAFNHRFHGYQFENSVSR
ncbi:hypothetical protein A2U01_0084602, partial [Trifolium medium]|nr:hypothetical protein [Trifolium medium]